VDAGSGSALKSIKLTAVATFVCSDVPSEEPMLLALDIVFVSGGGSIALVPFGFGGSIGLTTLDFGGSSGLTTLGFGGSAAGFEGSPTRS